MSKHMPHGQIKHNDYNNGKGKLKLHGKVRGRDKHEYVALESCTIINILKIFNVEKREFSEGGLTEKQKDMLHKLVAQNNAYNLDGSINPHGKHVLCVLPTVYQEITSHITNQYHRRDIENFVNKSMLVIHINPKYKKQFLRVRQILAKAYADHGYMCKNGKPTNDAYILAEASIFNINLFTLDSHIVTNKNTVAERKKQASIKEINRTVLGKQLKGLQSEPQTFLQFFTHGNDIVPVIENLDIMDRETQDCLANGLRYVPPASPAVRNLAYAKI